MVLFVFVICMTAFRAEGLMCGRIFLLLCVSFSFFLFDEFCDFFHCYVVRGFEGSYAGADEVGYVFVFLLFEVFHAEDLALFWRKCGYGLHECLLCLVAVEVVVGDEGCGSEDEVFVVQGVDVASLFDVGYGFVLCYAV